MQKDKAERDAAAAALAAQADQQDEEDEEEAARAAKFANQMRGKMRGRGAKSSAAVEDLQQEDEDEEDSGASSGVKGGGVPQRDKVWLQSCLVLAWHCGLTLL